MRLQPKRQVNVEVAKQKKADIDKGLELAGKIDALRETLAKEEQQLELFRTASVEAVKREIDSTLRELESVNNRIESRKDELVRLREPLDAEWEEIAEKKLLIEAEKGSLYQRRADLETGIGLNLRRERENDEERKRIERERRQIDEEQSLTVKLKEDALSALATARMQSDNIVSNALQRERAVVIREKEVAILEDDMSEREHIVNEHEKDLANRERALTDKYQTFERTINRFNK